MTKLKISFFRKIFDAIADLMTHFNGKPALVSAIVLAFTFVSLEEPGYAIPLLALIFVCNHFLSKRVQYVILFSLAIALAIHESPLLLPSKTQSGAKAIACGIVESVSAKASGPAFYINVTQQTSAKVDFSAQELPQDIWEKMQNKVRITEKRKLPLLPLPGDSLCYEASFYTVSPPTVPGAFDTQKWLNSQNLAAYGKFKHWIVLKHQWTFEKTFSAFRQKIRERFDKFLDPAETGLLMGLLAGDRSGIPEILRSDFQRSGLVHVLAISGFHVVLLAGMLMVFLKATGLPHKIVRIIAITLLFIYIPITGGAPAVRRAVMMFSIPQISAIFGRTSNTLNSLGVALVILILPEPEVIWNPGFQLSVAATAGILIGSPYNPTKLLPEWLSKNKIWQKIQGFAIEPTYVTLCATLSTAPFLIHHFKTLSPFAWFGNIIVVPAISLGMQAGLFALLSPVDFLCETFCITAKFFLRLASMLTRILSDSATASVTIGPFSPTILLIVSFLILLLPVIRKNFVARKYAFFCILLFCALFAFNSYNQIKHPTWNLTTIDVGQGDSHLVTTPSSRHFLIDAGDNSRQDSGKDIIVPFLHHIGVATLDALIITHPDKDHFGGALSILKMFPVKELWISECAHVEKKSEWQQILREANRRSIPIRDIHRGILWKENYFEMRTIHPRQDRCREANESSITFRIKGLNHSAILTGDLTTAGEKDILKTDIYLKSDILKLGHHGSKTSSSPQFLGSVAPQVAVISSGRRNKFKHPHKQVTNRLDSLHIPYLNTANKGSIMVTFSPDTMMVRTMLK